MAARAALVMSRSRSPAISAPPSSPPAVPPAAPPGGPPSPPPIELLGAPFTASRAEPPEASVARLTRNQGFDIIYDTVGGATLDSSFTSVRRYGHVVSALGWGTHAL